MKLSEELSEEFKRMRFDPQTHHGLGDINLTIGFADEIVGKIVALESAIEATRLYLRTRTPFTLKALMDKLEELDECESAG